MKLFGFPLIHSIFHRIQETGVQLHATRCLYCITQFHNSISLFSSYANLYKTELLIIFWNRNDSRAYFRSNVQYIDKSL